MPRLSRCGPRRPSEPSPAAPAGRGGPLRPRFLRRLRAALARAGRRSLPAALVLALALPLAVPAAAQEVVEVPRAWPLNHDRAIGAIAEFRRELMARNEASSLFGSPRGDALATILLGPSLRTEPESRPDPRSGWQRPRRRLSAQSETQVRSSGCRRRRPLHVAWHRVLP